MLTGRRSPPAEKAKEIIREMLKEGPQPQTEVASRMADEGISRKSWRTAKAALGVISTKKPDKSWEWSLPPKKDDPF